jgi:hypothetical protein
LGSITWLITLFDFDIGRGSSDAGSPNSRRG